MTDRELLNAVIGNEIVPSSDVVILLEGDGFSRLPTTARLYNEGVAKQICFSGGIVNLDYGSFPFEMYQDKLSEYNLKSSDFVLELSSQHTFQQAEEIFKLAETHNWQTIILVASPFHQLRAFLTFLKVMRLKGLNLGIFNYPAENLAWFKENPWGRRIDLIKDEIGKIEIYAEKGHCCTYLEGLEYQKWKEAHYIKK